MNLLLKAIIQKFWTKILSRLCQERETLIDEELLMHTWHFDQKAFRTAILHGELSEPHWNGQNPRRSMHNQLSDLSFKYQDSTWFVSPAFIEISAFCS